MIIFTVGEDGFRDLQSICTLNIVRDTGARIETYSIGTFDIVDTLRRPDLQLEEQTVIGRLRADGICPQLLSRMSLATPGIPSGG